MIKYIVFIWSFILVQFICCDSIYSGNNQGKLSERLLTFNKLYGYVKYFHPSDEAAELDWDTFAIYGVKRILESKEEDFKTVLEELFLPIAPSMLLYSSGENAEIDFNSFLPQNSLNLDTIRWQHIGNGNFNNLSTYKSSRTKRKSKYFPAPYYRETIKISFKKEFESGAYNLTFKVKNKHKDNYHRTYIDICYVDKSDSLICDRDLYYENDKWESFGRTFSLSEKSDEISIKISPRSVGDTFIGELKLFRKNGRGWDEVSFINWDDNTTLNMVSFEEKETEKRYYDYSLTNNAGKNNLLIKSKVILKSEDLLFENMLHYGEYIEENIGSDLTCLIPLVLLGNEESTFPIGDITSLNNLEKKLCELSESKSLSGHNLELRIGNLINMWNSVHHFYPYFDVIKTDWYHAFEEALKDSFKDGDSREFLFTLRSILSKLEDGHVEVNSNDINFYYPPIFADYVENKVIITGANEVYERLIGAEIEVINGAPVKVLLSSMLPYVSSVTKDKTMKTAARDILASDEKGGSLKMEIKTINGTSEKVKIKSDLSSFNHYQLDKATEKVSFKRISDITYYINLDLLTFEDFKNILPELQGKENIIIDMRGYPAIKGNIRKLIGHFIEANDSTRWLFKPNISRPDRFNYMQSLSDSWWFVKTQTPHIDAKIYFLINQETQSYAESVTGFFNKMDNVTLVGSPTTGVNGNVNRFSLPGGYSYRYTGMKALKHDGSRLHGIGFLPDVEVRPTIKGIIEGRDEVLEKAIELAKRNN